MKSQGEIFKVTGLYWREAKSGNKYLQGKVGHGMYVKLFKNLHKKENSPDYKVCLDFENNNGQMLNITGLWIEESKEGSRYLQGRVGGCYVKAFKNNMKRSDSDPDYNLCMSLILDDKELDSSDGPTIKVDEL